MNIYIDADSITLAHRAIILRRLIGSDLHGIFVADRSLPDVLKAIEEDKAIRRKPYRDNLAKDELRKIGSNIEMIVVKVGENSADDMICEIAKPPALLITHDIPLAARAIEKGIHVMDDRGNELDSGNIANILSERNVNAVLRTDGVFIGSERGFDRKVMRKFSETFDRMLFSIGRI